MGLAVWLLVDALQSGRVAASVGAGALLVLGASCTVSAVGLASFSAEWVGSSAVLFALVVLAGAVLTIAAGVDCLRTALPTARAGTVNTQALVLGGAGVAAVSVALFVKYDGEKLAGGRARRPR